MQINRFAIQGLLALPGGLTGITGGRLYRRYAERFIEDALRSEHIDTQEEAAQHLKHDADDIPGHNGDRGGPEDDQEIPQGEAQEQAQQLAQRYFHGGGHENVAGGKLFIGEDIPSPEKAADYVEQALKDFLQ